MDSHLLRNSGVVRTSTGAGIAPQARPFSRTAATRHPAEPAVALVDWPKERHLLEHLTGLGLPRLLLVAADADPPLVDDLLEDWLRVPAEDRDIKARVFRLAQRAGRRDAPVFDSDCRLSYRGSLAALSPIEHSLATLLVERFGRLVSDQELVARAWIGTAPGGGVLRVHLTRLRRRIGPMGLEIRTVRSRGHVMQATRTDRAFTVYEDAAGC